MFPALLIQAVRDKRPMTFAIETPTTMRLSGDVIATHIPYEAFLRQFQGQRVEWIAGTVIQMSPVTTEHNELTNFLTLLLSFYLARSGGGRVFTDPVVMRLANVERGRAPDVQVLLPESYDRIHELEITGAADLVIEVVSADSQRRDRVEKFNEYERGGVKEYWIIDPLRRETLFYALSDAGLYELVPPNAQGIFQSPVLPRLQFDPALFWQRPLPDAVMIVALVDQMLSGN